MGRAFSKSEARKLIDIHTKLLTTLDKCALDRKKYTDEVIRTVGELKKQSSLSALEDLPVEELNRDNSGIRVKLLRDHRYTTVASVYNASVPALCSISGISKESAMLIKRIAEQLAEQAASMSQVRLSADDKNQSATAVVKAIGTYMQVRDRLNEIEDCRAQYAPKIKTDIEAVKRVNGLFGWVSATEQRKNAAVEAFDSLQLFNNEYLPNINTLANEYKKDSQRLAFAKADWSDFERDPIAYYNIIEELCPGTLGDAEEKFGLPEELANEIAEQDIILDGLNCTLRHYQELGVKYIVHQGRVLLGDEMGLGKTVQAIATMVSLRNNGATHFVVVCPASVVTNWYREIGKHSDLNAIKVHGSTRDKAIEEWKQTGGVAVTTYETTEHFVLDDGYKYSLLVVDEAHYIKNVKAKRTANVVRLSNSAERMLFMTGTALENNVDEMIRILGYLNPAISAEAGQLASFSAAKQFMEKIAPVYYRRKRADVLTELPELIESKEWCTLSKTEQAIYEQTLAGDNFADVRRVSWNVDSLDESSKAQRLKEIVEEATQEGRKILVFSFFLDTIAKIKAYFGDKCLTPITGALAPAERQAIIDEFDNAPAGSILAAQIISGGTGLNIQSASVVVICEPQFKPSIENQAISRAYRMGQSRNVLVYRLLGDDTIDERITLLLEKKQKEFDAFADDSVAAEHDAEVDEQSFAAMLSEEKQRLSAPNPEPITA